MSIDRLVVAGPGRIPSTDLQAIARMAVEHGISFGTGVWAKGGQVYDWSLLKPLGQEAAAAIRAAFPAYDIALVEAVYTRPKLFVSDMDATMVVGESIDEMADALGVRDKVEKITERAMAGDLDFVEALNERVAMLKGLEAAKVEAIGEGLELQPGAEHLLSELRAFDIKTILVSGGFTLIANKVGKRLGFDMVFANELEIEDGVLTGKVTPPLIDKDAKVKILQDAVLELDIYPEQAIAMGDGANDIPMLQEAGFGVAFQGKEKVREATSYQINTTDHTTLLSYMDM